VSITIADLLTISQAYLTTNYAGYQFVKGEKETENGVVKYEVKIIFNGVKWEVKFNATGGFVKAERD
jgi:uncharacterized membrane protein YkoI